MKINDIAYVPWKDPWVEGEPKPLPKMTITYV
jgi:hypothetical protein